MSMTLMGRARMPSVLVTWLLAVLLSLAGCAGPQRDLELEQREQGLVDQAAVAAAIRDRYESALPDLPQSKQRHYAQRLYRITGGARYLPINRDYGRRLVSQIREEIEALDTPGHVERRA